MSLSALFFSPLFLPCFFLQSLSFPLKFPPFFSAFLPRCL
jgi:hypothetical protein